EAAEELATLAAVAPNEPQLTIELLERLFRRGPNERARSLFDHALSRFTRNREVLRHLAELATRWSEEDRSLEAWTRLRRLAPRDELAVLGLGEQLFQRKKRDLALRTWQALRDCQASKAEGHARLAEGLLEHDLLGAASAEAQKA